MPALLANLSRERERERERERGRGREGEREEHGGVKQDNIGMDEECAHDSLPQYLGTEVVQVSLKYDHCQ